MKEKLVRSIEDILCTYLNSDVIAGYVVKRDLIYEILDFYIKETISSRRKRNISVMHYLIAEAFLQHRDISDDNADSSLAVIYGDYFCTLYHRAVIDFKEFRINEKIIEKYKKMCIGSFEGRLFDPVPFLAGDKCL